jgi:streptogramin lyase
VGVTNRGDGTVSRIDLASQTAGDPITVVVQTIDVGAGPEGITAGPDSVWVANGEDDTVTQISP